MKWKVFSIKDTAVGVFNRPFCARASGEALRIFTDEVNRSDLQNSLYLHPKDFELWYLCMFDDVTGVFDGFDVAVVAVGVDVRLAAAE